MANIGQKNPAAAEKLYDRGEELAGLLADFPGIGTRRPDIDGGSVKTIDIPRVVDGRRDLENLF